MFRAFLCCVLLVTLSPACSYDFGTIEKTTDTSQQPHSSASETRSDTQGDTVSASGGETGTGDETEQDSETRPQTDTAKCAAAIAGYTNDFDSNSGGFVSETLPPGDGELSRKWEWGKVAAAKAPAGHGKVWAVGLSAYGYYSACDNAFLTSPEEDLSVCDGLTLRLRFETWHEYFNSNHGFTVEFYDGTRWTSVAPDEGWDVASVNAANCSPTVYLYGKPGFVGSSSGWETKTFSLSWTHYPKDFKFRFVHGSDDDNTLSGANIDNLVFSLQ